MRNFLRAVRRALRHRFTVAATVITALFVGLLWGINIGAVYPFVEVVMRGESLQDWVDDQIEESSTRIRELERRIRQQRSHAQLSPDLSRELERLESQRAHEEQARQRYQRLQPSIRKYAPDEPFQTLVWIVVALVIGTILKNIAMSINAVLVARIAQHTVFGLRKDLYRKTLANDVLGFDRRHNSVVVSHFTNDINKVSGGLSILFGKAMLEPFKMLFCFIGASLISWRLLVLSLLISPPALIVMRLLAKSIKRANHRAMEEMSQIYRVISETLSGIYTVKAFTNERFERHRFHIVLKQYLRTIMKIVFYGAVARPINELLGIGVISLSLIAGAYLVIEQQTHILGIKIADRPISLAALFLFYGFLAGISSPARKLSGMIVSLQGGFAAADRVYALMDRPQTVNDPRRPRPMPAQLTRLSLHDVTFAYEDDPVLRGINLEIRAGETVAIVGANGCGKSTLINLIPRFFDPSSGCVKWNNVDLRELRIHDIRSRLSVVTQHPHLFDDSVFNNIRYGARSASHDDVVNAAQRAHAHTFIMERLPQGYESAVGQRGNCLSGGQRQRIALARAILRDPELLILDEATSQIDIESEQAIHQALRSFVRGRTAIMVTHRLSTLQLATRVLVMDAGRVVDVGSHDELIARCDIYQRLHEIHFRRSA